MKFNKITFIFAFFTCLFLQAQIEEKHLDKLVQKTLKTFDVPGISVGILKDGKVVYAKGHGVRALSNQKDMNENTLVGYVALAFAEKHPDYINGLCLMNSTPFADSQLRYDTRTRAIKAAKKNYKSLVSMSISNLFYEKNRELFSEDIEALKTEALKTPLQGYIATQEGMKLRKDRTEILKQLNCKKLIIAGKNDPILSLEDLESLKPINLLNISVLEGGHMSYIENESDFLQEIVYFIEKI